MPIPPLTKRLAKRDWRKKKWLKHGALSCIQHRRSADGRVKNIEFLLMKVRQREGLKWHCRSLKYDCAHGATHQTPFRNALNFPRVYKPPRNKFDSFFFFFFFSSVRERLFCGLSSKHQTQAVVVNSVNPSDSYDQLIWKRPCRGSHGRFLG